MSKLHFKYGAMNSGKSSLLINTAFNYTERGLEVLVVKPAVDTKGNDWIVSRSGGRRQVDHLVTTDTNMIALAAINEAYPHALLVDEAQFLTARQVSQLLYLAKFGGVSVIAYGLRTDFKSELFEGSKRLFELADVIEKMPTMCVCGSQAEFNMRMLDGQPTFDGTQVAIEGLTRYISTCGKCYIGASTGRFTE